MSGQDERQEQIQKLWSLIKDIQFGMLTTVAEHGTLRSRPMAAQTVEFDGDLWFFTYASSAKADTVRHNQQVNVSFANPDDNAWVSTSGTAQIVRDRNKMEQLWNSILKTWFPKGLDEPDIALLKVHVTKAEYWDAPSSVSPRLWLCEVADPWSAAKPRRQREARS